jgi:hypothetical protein
VPPPYQGRSASAQKLALQEDERKTGARGVLPALGAIMRAKLRRLRERLRSLVPALIVPIAAS